jgi:hypothetical protein
MMFGRLKGGEYSRVQIPMRILHRIAIGFATLFFSQALGAQASAGAQKTDSRAVAEWKARVPEIQMILGASNEETCYGAPSPTILDAFGLSTDRLSVALVEYCSSGAYTDALIPMVLDHGRPVKAKIRSVDGKNLQSEFVSGASAMHSRSARLVAEKNAIYDRFTDNDNEGKIATCGVKGYVWNARSRTFDLNTSLSKSASAEYCRHMRAENK